MTAAIVTAEPALIGARVYAPTGRRLGIVRAVDGAAFCVTSPDAPAGQWLRVERIQLFAAGRVYLTAA
ncbi:MAG TPA: hypothetical protein VFD32_07645 [Dehalococcoidia bacterium]|nr:hypothetical protein [Dehalococcoidia bacterium]